MKSIGWIGLLLRIQKKERVSKCGVKFAKAEANRYSFPSSDFFQRIKEIGRMSSAAVPRYCQV